MNKPRRHGAFFAHFAHLLLIAHQARNQSAEAVKDNPQSMPPDTLIAVVFSAVGAEAFINELAKVAQRDSDLWGHSFSNTDSLRNLATKLAQIDNDRPRDQLQAKYLEASKILSGQALERRRAPFQEFNELFQLRDALVHPRHQHETDQAGYISPRLRVARDLQQRGLTYTRGRRPGDIPGGMSWLNEIETLNVATWAY